MSRLYPDLEQSMRDIDLLHQITPHGEVPRSWLLNIEIWLLFCYMVYCLYNIFSFLVDRIIDDCLINECFQKREYFLSGKSKVFLISENTQKVFNALVWKFWYGVRI